MFRVRDDGAGLYQVFDGSVPVGSVHGSYVDALAELRLLQRSLAQLPDEFDFYDEVLA